MANELDPFDISFADKEEQPKKKSPRLKWGEITNNINKYNNEKQDEPISQGVSDTSDEIPPLPTIDVPEIETHVEDLPKEEENEKELVIDRVEDEPNEVENSTNYEQSLAEQPIGDFSDREMLEDVGGEPFDEKDVIDPEEEMPDVVTDEEIGNVGGDDIPIEEEVAPSTEKEEEPIDKEVEEYLSEARALAQDDLKGFNIGKDWKNWTAKQKADAIKAYMEKRAKESEPKEEVAPPMTEEEALSEARALAQDDLKGFKMPAPHIWSKLSTKEKLDIIHNFLEKNRDNITDIDENTTNNYETYKHYPVGLKIAEMVRQGLNSASNRIHDASKQNLAGGDSINNAVARESIPHYDYRSFFR